MFVTAAIGTPAAQAQTYTVLYEFNFSTDGSSPNGKLVGDSAGNLYGTASLGGLGYGVVFKLNKTGETVLYSFTNGADRGFPYGGVIQDSAGNLYGTTGYGGASGNGTVFKLDTNGTEIVLYSFTGGADSRDSASTLYGTANAGGACNQGCGVVFRLQP